MHTYREIKFKSTPSTSKFNADKVCYQGQVIHNRTLSPEETRDAFADYAKLLKRPLSDLAIDSVATGTRTLEAYGGHIYATESGIGEGVRIEDDTGEKLLTGRLLSGCDVCTCRFELTGDIAPGLYWLALCSRTVPNGPLLRCRRRITAV